MYENKKNNNTPTNDSLTRIDPNMTIQQVDTIPLV